VPACRQRLIILLAGLALGALSSAAALAQQSAAEQQAADAADPPARAARLSYLEGAVSVQPAGVDEWTAAGINRPLTIGDLLWSERAARAEIELGFASVRLAERSALAVLDLGDAAAQLQLAAGTTNITLRAADAAGGFEIDAPNAAVVLLQPGSYRIEVDDLGNSTVGLRDGLAQVITSTGEAISLRAGQAAQFGPEGGIDVAALGAPDEFDRWCAQREARWARNQQAAAPYVSGDVVGAQDLADYGAWRDEPDYGYVWFPSQVAPDWAPYRYGRWLWISPWGWTWVDSAPWGYAPFHYGRWAYLDQRWAWVPVPAGSRTLYAPALVAWMGGPTPNGALAGAAGVGWLPLARGEIYLPGYRVSARYLHVINLSNTTILSDADITRVEQTPQLQNRYANRTAPRALTVVSLSVFASGQSTLGRTLAPPPEWSEATPRPPPIAPARSSVLGPRAPTAAPRPPSAILHRAVVARHQPPPPPRAFDRQLDAIRANGGLALSGAQLQQLPAADSPRVRIVLAPPPAPVSPAAEFSIPPAAPAIHETPLDRRVIPERSPHYQPPAQSHPRLPAPTPVQRPPAPASPPAAPARQLERPVAAPPPTAPPPPPAPKPRPIPRLPPP
jgi:hypothetical protein